MKKSLLLLSLSFLCYLSAFSQDEPSAEWLLGNGNSNAGTEFYMTFHPSWETSGTDNFLKIYVTSEFATEVTVTVEGKGFEHKKKTVPNEIIVFDLPPNIGQPYSKDNEQMPEEDQVWSKAAIHVVAEAPIICYGVTRFRRTSDGYLALPLHSYGREYIISSWADMGDNSDQYLTSYSSCIAPYDKTKVRFTAGGPSFSRTTTDIKVGESKTYTLNSGDVLLMASLGSYSELSSSKFSANKPINVISGNFCSFVPEFTPYCDFMIEQELPGQTWGKTYVVTPIIKREKNSWVKLYARESGTQIYRNGILFGELTKGGGGRPGESYFSFRSLDDGFDPQPVVFSSNKPFSLTQYNTSQTDDDVPSDPFQMVLVPYEQWSNSMNFMAPGHLGDGFSSNYLNIIYQATEDGLMPDDLVLGTSKNGEFDWVKIRDVYPDPGMELTIQIDGKRFFAKSITLDGEGVYALRAKDKFNAYIYGFSTRESYGCPAGAQINNLDYPNDSLAPECNPYVDCFGVVRDADKNGSTNITATDQPDIERSNIAQCYALPAPYSYNFNFEVDDFVPGETRSALWSAEVIDNNEDARLIYVVLDRNGNMLLDTLEFHPYRGKIVAADGNDGNFGNVEIGSSKSLNYKVINESETEELCVSYLKLITDNTGYWTYEKYREVFFGDTKELPEQFQGDQGFKILDMKGNPVDYDFNIPPLGNFEFQVEFTATKEGTFRDSLGLGNCDQCHFGYWLPLKASVGNAIIEVSDADFGEVMAGTQSEYKTISIKNIGNIDLEIREFEGPFIREGTINPFIHQDLTSNGFLIKPNSNYTFQVKFWPQSQREYLDTIIFVSNAGETTDNLCILTGTGFYDKDALVPDLFFGDAKEHVTTEKLSVSITNNGTTPLEILDFEGPFHTEEDPDGKTVHNFIAYGLEDKINPEEGLKVSISGGTTFRFDVDFTPHTTENYQDSIVFTFNKDIDDNVCKLVASDITGVEEQIAKTIALYPNPTRDFVNIKFEDPDLYVESIELLDNIGLVLINTENIYSDSHSIDLRKLSSGYYILKIKTNKGEINKSVILLK
jgi:hypothetical protein